MTATIDQTCQEATGWFKENTYGEDTGQSESIHDR
jgi:hypothetical protein